MSEPVKKCAKHRCKLTVFGDGDLCAFHSIEMPHVKRTYTSALCSINGCERPRHSRGWCQAHYVRWKKHGSPDVVIPKDRKKIQWIEDNANHSGSDCLKWPFGVGDRGRGTAMFNGVKNFSAPRAMCWVAHGAPPTEKHEAAHSCGNGHNGCMNPNHLSWKTRKENEADKIEHGTVRRGAKINTAKLTEADVREIRRMVGTVKVGVITRKFGISRGQVYKIRDRDAWAWLED